MQDTLERPAMGRPKGRPKKSERDDIVVKVDRAVVSQARRIAEFKGITVAEVISEAARANVAKAFLSMLRDLGEAS